MILKKKNKIGSRQRERTTKKTKVTERGGRHRADRLTPQFARGGTTTGLQSSTASVNSCEPSGGADQIELAEPNALARAVRDVAIDGRVLSFEKRRQIADLIEREFGSRGEFCRTHDGILYFLLNSERRLLDVEHPEFTHLLMDVSGLSRTETFFKFVLDHLTVLARRALRREVYTLSHYDEATGMLSVSDGGSGVWIRARGDHWQRTLNGENGILFRSDPNDDPWTPEFRSIPDSGELTHLGWFMEQFPFVPYNEVSPDSQRALLRMSLFQRFFPPLARTNLIPTFLGPPGSGKSTAQRLLGRLLVGRRFELSDLNAESYDSFVAAITNHVVHGVDNVDVRVRWFPDAIARYATGIRFTKRRPRSLNDPVSHSPIAWLTLSSCNPPFTRSDIADRLLPLHFGRLEGFRPEGAIFGELERRRNAIIGDLLHELGRIEDRLATTSHIVGNVRMADFASFAQRAAEKDPTLARGQLASLRGLQLDFASDSDDLIEVLRLLLELNFAKREIPFTPVAALYGQCVEMAKSAHLRLPATLQGFAQRVSNEKFNIESRLDVKYSELRGHGNRRKVRLEMSGSAWKNPPWPPSPAVSRVKRVMLNQADERIR